MLPIEKQAESDNFNELVRVPGKKFLSNNPTPKSNEWKEYWQIILPDMRNAYKKICAYCSCWIPHGTGSHSIDHFLSKNIYPNLAYEWDNYRYVSARFNSRKGTKNIIDPFSSIADWFVLDFDTFLIKSNSLILSDKQKHQVNNTIQILKLNVDEDLVMERQQYYEAYKKSDISLDYLTSKAPFIAYELNRQGLVIPKLEIKL